MTTAQYFDGQVRTASYTYDSDGRRVKRNNGLGEDSTLSGAPQGTVSSGRTWRSCAWVRRAAWARVAEVEVWGGAGASPSSSVVQWMVADHLGTPRMTVDQTGSLAGVRRRDFLPFGEELTVGGRTSAQGYAGDSSRFKFTTYERDEETKLDYAQARYYANSQGRFISADPLFINADRLLDPQQLNIYTYARNNPLKFTDPSGLEVYLEGTQQKDYIESLNNRDKPKFSVANIDGFVRIVDNKGKSLGNVALAALGKTLSGGEAELFKAITDTNTCAVIDTGNGQPNDFVDFGSNDAQRSGGPQGRNTLDMPEMKLLDASENKGGMTSGNAVAHETLEAYGSAKGMKWEDAHKYATEAFGTFEYQYDRPTGPPDFMTGVYRTGIMVYDAVKPDGTRTRTLTTREYPKGYRPGAQGPTAQRIIKVEVIP